MIFKFSLFCFFKFTIFIQLRWTFVHKAPSCHCLSWLEWLPHPTIQWSEFKAAAFQVGNNRRLSGVAGGQAAAAWHSPVLFPPKQWSQVFLARNMMILSSDDLHDFIYSYHGLIYSQNLIKLFLIFWEKLRQAIAGNYGVMQLIISDWRRVFLSLYISHVNRLHMVFSTIPWCPGSLLSFFPFPFLLFILSYPLFPPLFFLFSLLMFFNLFLPPPFHFSLPLTLSSYCPIILAMFFSSPSNFTSFPFFYSFFFFSSHREK